MKLRREPNASWCCNIASFYYTWMCCMDAASGCEGVLYARRHTKDPCMEVDNGRGRVRVMERGVGVCWDVQRKGIENENDAPMRMVGC